MSTADPPKTKLASRGRSPLPVVDDDAVAAERALAATILKAQALLAAGREVEALAVLTPLAVPPWSRGRVVAATVLASVLVERDGADEAVHLLEDAPLELSFTPAVFLMVLAQGRRRLGRLDDAVDAAARACAFHPGLSPLLVLAECQKQHHLIDDAVATLRKAHRLFPDELTVLGHLVAYGALQADRDVETDAFDGEDVVEEKALRQRFEAWTPRSPAWWRLASLVAACDGDVDAARGAFRAAKDVDVDAALAFLADAPELQALGIS